MKEIHFIKILFLLCMFGACQTKSHSFDYIELFESEFVASRPIQIYLPPSYLASNKKYPVLYMQDGQMLFDSTTTWNGQEWGVDETMNQLITENKIRETIVVGIWNGGSDLRHSEYFPQKPFENLAKSDQDSLYSLYRSSNQPLFGSKIQSDNYLEFLTKEVKPFIDSVYRTKDDLENTYIMGSSMGGLISMYAIYEYPEVFGAAACMSTHWPGTFSNENNPIPSAFFKYMGGNIPLPKNHKWYFDYGTETLDSMYQTLQPQADSILLANGYTSKNFISLRFEGDPHDEHSWRNRLHNPLIFLLEK